MTNFKTTGIYVSSEKTPRSSAHKVTYFIYRFIEKDGEIIAYYINWDEDLLDIIEAFSGYFLIPQYRINTLVIETENTMRHSGPTFGGRKGEEVSLQLGKEDQMFQTRKLNGNEEKFEFMFLQFPKMYLRA